MKAVILAAGASKRLKPITDDKPKCLLKIGDIILIDYQIEALKSLGIKDIFVICGYKAKKLIYLKQQGVQLIYNEKYEIWNNIYSFYLTKNIKSDFVLINCDVLFHKKILAQLLDNDTQCGATLCIDDKKYLSEEEMKVKLDNDKIINISKYINPDEAGGEYIGLAKFKYNKIKKLYQVIENLISKGKTNLWYEDAFNYIFNEINFCCLFTSGLPWIEIDTIEDYENAKTLGNLQLGLKNAY